jgi:hypothetical protein
MCEERSKKRIERVARRMNDPAGRYGACELTTIAAGNPRIERSRVHREDEGCEERCNPHLGRRVRRLHRNRSSQRLAQAILDTHHPRTLPVARMVDASRSMALVGKEQGFAATRLDALLGWARKYSMFAYPFATACCSQEYFAVASPRFDLARFGAEIARFSPRQADVLWVVGTIAQRQAPVLKRRT